MNGGETGIRNLNTLNCTHTFQVYSKNLVLELYNFHKEIMPLKESTFNSFVSQERVKVSDSIYDSMLILLDSVFWNISNTKKRYLKLGIY